MKARTEAACHRSAIADLHAAMWLHARPSSPVSEIHAAILLRLNEGPKT